MTVAFLAEMLMDVIQTIAIIYLLLWVGRLSRRAS